MTDWEKNSEYSSGYDEDTPVIKVYSEWGMEMGPIRMGNRNGIRLEPPGMGWGTGMRQKLVISSFILYSGSGR